MSPPAACCGATRRCGVRSRSGPCASPSASGSAGRGWRWHANSRSCCTPCGATARSSSGGGLRHRHQPKTSPASPRLSPSLRCSLGDGGKVSREGGTGWDASEATRLARAASPCDADYEDGSVPLQLPHPAPITCIEPRRERCRLREATGVQGWATPVRKLSNIISAARNCRSVRGCAFGAPLRGCGA